MNATAILSMGMPRKARHSMREDMRSSGKDAAKEHFVKISAKNSLGSQQNHFCGLPKRLIAITMS
jgi:hypothetical protein